MSQENVDIVRRAYERFNAGDIDGFLRFCSTGFEFRDLPLLPGSGVFVGHEAFRAWLAQFSDAFDDVRFETDAFIDAGERDQVVVVNRATGRGKGSAAAVETRFSNVWTLRGGQIVGARSYDRHEDALEAVGMRE